MLAVLTFVVVRYHVVIIQTLEIAGIILASGLGTALIGYGAYEAWRWRTKTKDSITASIEDEADILERPDTEVRWNSSGDLEVVGKDS